jgi:hypothetical protein
MYLCFRRRSKDVANSLHAARRLLRRVVQITLLGVAIFQSGPRAQKASRCAEARRYGVKTLRGSKDVASSLPPRGSCCAVASNRLLSKLFTSLSGLDSQKALTIVAVAREAACRATMPGSP